MNKVRSSSSEDSSKPRKIKANVQVLKKVLTKNKVPFKSRTSREELCELVLEHGGKVEGNRLIYPPDLITNTIEQHQRIVLLAGQTIENDLHVGGNYVYAGTGGAAPN